MKPYGKGIMAGLVLALVFSCGCGDQSATDVPATEQTAASDSDSFFTNWSAVGTGNAHTCAIASGYLYCWGAGLNGELGNGGNSSSNSRVWEASNSTNWESVTAGWSHTCAKKTDASVYCWGYNSEGQLGDGTSADRNIPTRVGSGNDWSSLSAGGSHTCAQKVDGTIWCWGMNDHGQIGAGTDDYRYKSPVQVGASTGWTKLSAGMWHTCAVKKDGTLWCWGYGWYGQLGNGSILDKNKPAKVNTDKNWSLVAAGREHTCAKKKDGSVYCWGSNDFGQLGIGKVTAADKKKPLRVGTASDWNALSLGQYFSCGKRKSNIYCWGSNGSGQMGIGNEISPKPRPVRANGTGWMAISVGELLSARSRPTTRSGAGVPAPRANWDKATTTTLMSRPR